MNPYPYPPPYPQQAPPQYPYPPGYPPPYYGPSPYAQAAQDDSQLKTLSALHYAYGGLVILVTVIFLGIALLGAAEAPAREKWIAGVFGIMAMMGGAWATLVMVAAASLARRKRRTLCVVTAAITCAHLPLGTALGVFTLITLSRPSVRATFDLPNDAR